MTRVLKSQSLRRRPVTAVLKPDWLMLDMIETPKLSRKISIAR